MNNTSSSLAKQSKVEIDTLATEKGLTIENIAKKLKVSRSHLIRSFKKHYKLSPWKYCQEVRIRKSKELLMRGYYVKEAADMCGFESIYHFSHVFKKITGSCPTAYVKQERNIDNLHLCDY